MTDEDLKAIEARLRDLPRGPWYVEQARPGHEDEARVYDRGSWGVCKPTPNQPLYRRPIAEFVAHAPDDVLALIAEVRRLRAKPRAQACADHGCQVLPEHRHALMVAENASDGQQEK